jgi:hypothetical protein
MVVQFGGNRCLRNILSSSTFTVTGSTFTEEVFAALQIELRRPKSFHIEGNKSGEFFPSPMLIGINAS